MTKYALIINGDVKHLQNVERSLANKFEEEDYETYVASPRRPESPHDHYVEPTIENIQQLVAELKTKIGANDELVVYTTGDSKIMASPLDGIHYGQRTVIMDQSFSGNWNKIFLDDPKTLFITTGSKNETALATKFWDKIADIPDLNKDGMINWQERYAHAASFEMSQEKQLLQRIAETNDPNALVGIASELAEANLGETAIPVWEKLIANVGKIKNTPTRSYTFQKIAHILAMVGLKKSTGPILENLIPHAEIIAEKIENAQQRFYAFRNIASILVAVDPLEAVPVFERSIDAAEKIKNAHEKSSALKDIAFILTKARLEDMAVIPVWEKLITTATNIEDRGNHLCTLPKIAFILAEADLGEMAIPIWEKLIATAEKIKTVGERFYALQTIASTLAKAGLREKTVYVLEKLTTTTEEEDNALLRAHHFHVIASALDEAGLRERAISIWNKSIIAAGKIEDIRHREHFLLAVLSALNNKARSIK